MNMKPTHLLYVALAVTVAACSSVQGTAGIRERHFRTSDGVRLRYLESGSGIPVVLVPGWTMPADVFLPQLREPNGLRMVALDPRAQGWSEAPRGGHYPERRAEDLHELIVAAGAERPVLVGWSIAVSDVIAFVQRYPGETRGIILVDGAIANSMTLQRLEGFLKTLRRYEVDREAFAQKFVASLFKVPQSEHYCRRLREAVIRSPADANITLVANTMTRDWREVLEAYDKPVTYIITPQLQSDAAILRSVVPHGEVVTADTGHAIFVDDPELLVSAIRSVIARAAR